MVAAWVGDTRDRSVRLALGHVAEDVDLRATGGSSSTQAVAGDRDHPRTGRCVCAAAFTGEAAEEDRFDVGGRDVRTHRPGLLRADEEIAQRTHHIVP